jgi:hypothetical protein
MFVQDETTTNLLRNNEPQPIPVQNLRVKTWFLRNEKNEIIAVDEKSAWHMTQPNQNLGTYKPNYTIIGVSMATIYAKAVEEINKDKTLTPEQKRVILLQAEQDELVEARKNKLRPRNPNVMDISGQPVTDPVVLGNLPK